MDDCKVDEGGVASSDGDGGGEDLTQEMRTRRWGREGERRLKRKRWRVIIYSLESQIRV